MTKTVLLDTSPLGLLADSRTLPPVVACKRWANDLVRAGHRVIIPEVSDYEVRRKLLRLKKTASVRLLDLLANQFEYLPVTTPAFREAAGLWAVARQQGKPTAHPHALDCDVLLSAQALTLSAAGAVVATSNVAHLSQYVLAELWSAIAP